MKSNIKARSLLTLTVSLSISMIAMTGCNSGGSSSQPAQINPPVVKKVTKDTYLNGKKFCETYKEITSKEYGRYIQVPKNYSDPSEGTIEIYAYTTLPFNPSLPSYIYVDGGPGQNTHGMMPTYLDGKFNEFRFDQRGLGCSAPETWNEYENKELYSTKNNVLDMEEIRKAYGIKEWSVFGVSYGTVPATMYGSLFPKSTKSIVLEGVVGQPTDLHDIDFKVEKMNLAISGFNSEQKAAFEELLFSESEHAGTIIQLFFTLFYYDTGMRKMKSILEATFLSNGDVNTSRLSELKKLLDASENKYPYPQQPGAVDENILNLIYCKNLGARYTKNKSFNYSKYLGFYTINKDSSSANNPCDSVSPATEDIYNPKDYKTSQPVYYFQGSHDGATQASGAKYHWKNVPQKSSFFLLKAKGGHNPLTNQLTNSESLTLETRFRNLFKITVLGEALSLSDLQAVNSNYESDQKWKLYLSPLTEADLIDSETKGILKTVHF